MEDYLRKLFDTDKDKFDELMVTIREYISYCTKYGIDINTGPTSDTVNLKFCISVPGKSEFTSDSGFEMIGIYLANQFKAFVTDKISNLDFPELSKLRVKVNYTTNDNVTWTKEKSENNLKELEDILSKDSFYPYKDNIFF